MALSLSRNATVILSYQDSTATAFDGAGREPSEANTFEIPVLDGFSFSQATGTQNVTLNEAGASPKRGQSIFNTSIEPVDWSFTTYIRPRIDDLTTDLHGMTEKILWNALVSGVKTDNVGTGGITSTAATCTVDFEESNKNQLLKLTGWFVFSDSSTNYRLKNMCVNSASMDFDVDGIAQITWSGYAEAIDAVAAGATPTTGDDATDGYALAPSTADFILNRLSTVTLTSSISGSSKAYTFALTGGNVTIDNGISYVTPESLGRINVPIGHQTGTRAVSGNFTAYLDTAALSTKVMYDDILADINAADPDTITNVFAIALSIGGASAPKVLFNMPKAHLELPSLDTADVMGVTINWTALEDGFGTGNDEATIVYTGLTVV
tara:strand:- start:660 stop:1799 length:1140 start_codon:yes stop_codon:yes gene_type:complete